MTSLGIQNVLEFMHLAWSLYCITHSLLIIQSCYSYCSTIMPFSCLIVWNLLWDCVLVPRLPWQINMVSELTVVRSSYLSKIWFLTDLSWKMEQNLKNSSTASKAKAYHLIPQVKEFFYQACLINYVGCDESLKCPGYSTLWCPFCCDLQVLTGENHSLQ